MGEIIMFPGNPGKSLDTETIPRVPGEIINLAQRRRRQAPGFFGELVRRIMGVLPEQKREELKAIIGGFELDEAGGRRGRHAVRANLEERWFEAHKQGNLEEQSRVEKEIGRRYQAGRGGKVIERLRMIGEFYDANKTP